LTNVIRESPVETRATMAVAYGHAARFVTQSPGHPRGEHGGIAGRGGRETRKSVFNVDCSTRGGNSLARDVAQDDEDGVAGMGRKS